tara:strand:- start:119 stop:679 length:561 start_codon:yes stop_codon:yes gene_type:complete
MSDVHINLLENNITYDEMKAEPWKISLIDTGEESMTGGRIQRIKKFVNEDEFFFLTYGDGLANIDIAASLKNHEKSNKLATITCVRPPGRFGAVEISNGKVKSFIEKPEGKSGLINGGFFILSPKIFDYIENEQTSWERESLKNLAEDSQLNSYFHDGFWQPMDTLRDKIALEELWEKQNAPWKVW